MHFMERGGGEDFPGGAGDAQPMANVGLGLGPGERIEVIAAGDPLRQLAHSMMDLSLSRETQSNLSQDHQEAVTAFAQKRQPNFTGR